MKTTQTIHYARPLPGNPHYIIFPSGKIYSIRRGKFLKEVHQSYGYLFPSSRLEIDGVKKQRTIHSIIARTFLGPVPQGLEINHKDGNKHNNSIDNLEYCTRQENLEHAVKNGLFIGGKQNRKIGDKGAIQIRWMATKGYTRSELARIYGVSRNTIRQILDGITYKEVTA